MNKELDALECLEKIHLFVNGSRIDGDKYEQKLQELNTIKQALQRLEAIDNANPSEALECVDDIYRNAVFVKKEVELKSFTSHHKLFGESPETSKTISEQCTTIKQALIKAQEQEKVLSIIKEKKVLIVCLLEANTLEDYNCQVMSWNELSQEEFDLLKRWENE